MKYCALENDFISLLILFLISFCIRSFRDVWTSSDYMKLKVMVLISECVETSTIKNGYAYKICAKKLLILEESVIFPFTISVGKHVKSLLLNILDHEVIGILFYRAKWLKDS